MARGCVFRVHKKGLYGLLTRDQPRGRIESKTTWKTVFFFAGGTLVYMLPLGVQLHLNQKGELSDCGPMFRRVSLLPNRFHSVTE